MLFDCQAEIVEDLLGSRGITKTHILKGYCSMSDLMFTASTRLSRINVRLLPNDRKNLVG